MHFGPRLLAFAAFQKMICGVSYERSAWDSSRCWVSPWRAPHCVVPCSVLPGVPSPPEMPWWRRCGPAPSSTPMRRAEAGRSSGLAVGLHDLRETVYEILPPWFRAGASVLGKNYAGTLGVDGWAPYRCFKEATLQTCYNHLLHRCHELRRRPRAGRASHAWSRPSSGTPSPCAIGAMLARSARMACALKGLLQAKMNRLCTADSPILPTSDSRNISTLSGQPLCVPRPCGRRGHQLSRRTRHSHRRTARPAEAATVPRKGHRPSRSS